MRVFIIAALFAGAALAAKPTSGEIKEANQWRDRYFNANSKTLPFSFIYGGKPSAELLPTWSVRGDQAQTGGSSSRSSFTWTDPKTHLEVRCVAVEYLRWPVIEWTA